MSFATSPLLLLHLSVATYPKSTTTIPNFPSPSFLHRRCTRTRYRHTCPPVHVTTPSPSFSSSATPYEDQERGADNSPSSFSWRDHWYAVSLLEDLDPTVPTPFQLLNRDLVIWKDPSSSKWVALDDRCPHRLAPLSEGRIDESGWIQCSYHGWSFDREGKCRKIPQASNDGPEANAINSPRACAIKLPTLVSQGLLFVWPDENGWEMAASTQPPFNLLHMDDFENETMDTHEDDPVDEELDEDGQPKFRWHPLTTEEEKTSKTLRPKSNDPAWKYGVIVNMDSNKVKCLFCHFISKAGIARLKGHLIGGDRNCVKCYKVTKFVRNEVLAYENARKSRALAVKMSKKQMVLEVDEECDDDMVIVDDSSSLPKRAKKRSTFIKPSFPSSSGSNNISLGALSLKDGETLSDIVRRRMKEKQPVIAEKMKKEEKLLVDQYVAKFFYNAGVSFNVRNCFDFHVMCEAIGRFGRGYVPPSITRLRGSLLEGVVCEIDEMKKAHESAWARDGCTLMSDGWTDKRGRSIINFLVNSTKGSFYLYSIDASAETKTADYIASTLDKAMQRIGVEKVVQICTDNASNYVKAGDQLMEKYSHLYWTPCVAHCLDLMLEDIGKITSIKNAIVMGRKITNFIYNHSVIHSEFLKKSNNRELVRCGVTRFATSFLTLQSIKNHRDTLSGLDWRRWIDVGCGQQIHGHIFNNIFWKNLDDCLAASGPLVILLRLVDEDSRPSMAEVIPRLEIARNRIEGHFASKPTILPKLKAIFQNRWDKHFDKPLFGAGAFLNPQFYYNLKNSSREGNMKSLKFERDFRHCMMRMAPVEEQQAILEQLTSYKNARGDFSLRLATQALDNMDPTSWWSAFGISTPELMMLALRIVNLSTTASSCERNWSTFDFIHTKRRNRLEVDRLHKLVYINYNQRLNDRYEKLNREDDKEYDPIAVNDINYCSEWVTGVTGPSAEFVYEDEGLRWVDVWEAAGVPEYEGPSTRARVIAEDDEFFMDPQLNEEDDGVQGK